MSDLLGEQLTIDGITDTGPSEHDIRNILGNYCVKKISHDDAENQLKQLIGNSTPLDVIDETISKATRQSMNSGQISRAKSKRWSEGEDIRLKEAIEKFGTDNWAAVSNYVGENRTKAQCSQRWNRCLNPNISHNNWTREEEEKLLDSVQRFGDRAWTRVANELPGRTDVQCRFRFKFMTKKSSNGSIQHINNSLTNEFNSEIDMPPVELPIAPSPSLHNDVIIPNPNSESSISPSLQDTNILDQTQSEHN